MASVFVVAPCLLRVGRIVAYKVASNIALDRTFVPRAKRIVVFQNPIYFIFSASYMRRDLEKIGRKSCKRSSHYGMQATLPHNSRSLAGCFRR